MQGMIAEYERAKIMERHRRGKIHTAKRGSINALSVAAYGYRYIDKYTNGGEASFEVIEEEAEVVRKIFNWIGKERLTLGKVAQRLKQEQIPTKKGKSYWLNVKAIEPIIKEVKNEKVCTKTFTYSITFSNCDMWSGKNS